MTEKTQVVISFAKTKINKQTEITDTKTRSDLVFLLEDMNMLMNP